MMVQISDTMLLERPNGMGAEAQAEAHVPLPLVFSEFSR
jgi:hypothetical protein